MCWAGQQHHQPSGHGSRPAPYAEGPPMTTRPTEDLLRGLAPAVRADASAALDWLLPGGDLEDLSLLALLEFLGYQLPTKWLVSTEEQHRIARSLGTALEQAGLDRYAALCRDAAVHRIIDVAETDRTTARTTYDRLAQSTGVLPPDTDVLRWGAVQGMEEFRAGQVVSAALERAVVSGALVPGRRGWRAKAVEVAEATLLDVDDHGRTLCEAVETERLADWLDGLLRRSWDEPTIARLTAALDERTTATEIEALAASVEPLAWFLEQVGDGIALTARGNLSRRLVQAADERYRWTDGSKHAPVRAEQDLHQLVVIHDIAESARLVTRRASRLALSSSGRELRADHRRLLTAALGALLDVDRFEGDAAIGAAIVMLAGPHRDAMTAGQLDAALTSHLGSRWRRGDDPLTRADISSAALTLLTAGGVFGWFAEPPPGQWSRVPEPTALGRSALSHGLRSVACGPRSRLP